MILLGGDFDDAIDVIDVWMYVNAPATILDKEVFEPIDENTISH